MLPGIKPSGDEVVSGCDVAAGAVGFELGNEPNIELDCWSCDIFESVF